MPTPTLKLIYFDFPGGRGEAARIALSSAGVPFEDDRVRFDRWPGMKPTTPLGGLPILEIDGVVVSQSNTINRLVGRLSGLYPEDPVQAAFCDEPCDAFEALYGEMHASFNTNDPVERQRLREACMAGPLPLYLRAVAKMLADRGGEWFADGRLTMADLKVMEGVRHLSTGKLDHIPKDIVDQVAPTLREHFERVQAEPRVAAYYERAGA